MVTIELKNYYCPHCDKQLASADILCGKHVDCHTKAVWTRWDLLSLDDSHRVANMAGVTGSVVTASALV